jgi:hypothetical protein
LIKKKVEETLFEEFGNHLKNLGLYVNEGKIIDAGFVEVPRQRNTKEENAQIRAGKGDELWNGTPRKKRQKYIDARWTEKGGEKFYGYKDRVKIDSGYKLIDTYEVTSAEVRDSQPTEDLIDEKTEGGQPLYADSACAGKKQIIC